MVFLVDVHARIALRCDWAGCPAEHVVFEGRVRTGERLTEPLLPLGWLHIATGTRGAVVLCPDHVRDYLTRASGTGSPVGAC